MLLAQKNSLNTTTDFIGSPKQKKKSKILHVTTANYETLEDKSPEAVQKYNLAQPKDISPDSDLRRQEFLLKSIRTVGGKVNFVLISFTYVLNINM